ncbi:MAG: hypothetical protein Q9O24_11540 [Gammaproteobacteria bacterium]|nr:hypothetical protein [Gammaproteobacteria bacterium]
MGSFTAFAGEKCGFGKHGFSPEKRAEFILKRVTGKLDLNETQVSKLKAVQAQFIQQLIVEAHGGELQIKSELGVGSSVVVRLPITNAPFI